MVKIIIAIFPRMCYLQENPMGSSWLNCCSCLSRTSSLRRLEWISDGILHTIMSSSSEGYDVCYGRSGTTTEQQLICTKRNGKIYILSVFGPKSPYTKRLFLQSNLPTALAQAATLYKYQNRTVWKTILWKPLSPFFCLKPTLVYACTIAYLICLQ